MFISKLKPGSVVRMSVKKKTHTWVRKKERCNHPFFHERLNQHLQTLQSQGFGFFFSNSVSNSLINSGRMFPAVLWVSCRTTDRQQNIDNSFASQKLPTWKPPSVHVKGITSPHPSEPWWAAQTPSANQVSPAGAQNGTATDLGRPVQMSQMS